MASFAPDMKLPPRLRQLAPLTATLASALAVIMIPGCASVEPAGGAAASSAAPAMKVIRGSIVYRDKTVLPNDAELVVRLLDVTRPDQPKLIASTTIPTAGRQVPLPFTLSYDPALATGTLHGLNASIRYGGKTRYVTATRVMIDPASPPQATTMTVVAGETEPEVTDSPMPRTGPNTGYPPGATSPQRRR